MMPGIVAGAPIVVVPPTDPYWSNVVSLLHFDGTNGSTTFTDAKLSTAQKRFGSASLACDGSGDWISTPDSDDFYLSGDFTIEAFVRTAVAGGSSVDIPIFSQYQSTASDSNRVHVNASRGLMTFYAQGTGSTVIVSVSTTYNMPANTWVHCAATRSGNTFRLFANGVMLVEDTQAVSLPNIAGPAYWGFARQASATRSLNGYLDDARITKGVARYTANFTPPSAPFPNSGP
jgi:hypothetical protein